MTRRYHNCLIGTVLTLLWLMPPTTHSATKERILIGSEIPRFLPVAGSVLFCQSDSLWLNQDLLTRGKDYDYVSAGNYFDLSKLSVTAHDTLKVRYQAAPNWIKPDYSLGYENQVTSPGRSPKPSEASPGLSQAGAPLSDVRVDGAKTFRFSSHSTGGAEFSQSLDLKIEGQLTKNTTLTGAVSDRGYDPAYGTANSRLSELDKVNLTLRSPRLLARVGDIRLPVETLGRRKDVSGAMVGYRAPAWSVEGVLARPKGRFATAKLAGQDGRQGPYRMGDASGGVALVPGSEEVYLDGRRLRSGANHDYIIDYAAGGITFTASNPISSRSRIEIDYEPLAAAYRGELFGGQTGVSLADSTVTIKAGWIRDGDDKKDRLLGDFSTGERTLLEQAGDSTVRRSGVHFDTAGAYVLVVDSLPDSVFQYVGLGKGDFRLEFSYLGPQAGSYRYLGNGIYAYSGQGLGEYEPVTALTAPIRQEFYHSTVRVSHPGLVEGSLHYEHSLNDRNLLSDIDSEDDDGDLLEGEIGRRWRWNDHPYQVNYRYRYRTQHFVPRRRLVAADFERAYLLPTDLDRTATETWHSLEGNLTPLSSVTVTPRWSQLRYHNLFDSRASGLDVILRTVKDASLKLGYRGIRSEYWQGQASSSGGLADTYSATLDVSPSGKLRARVAAESDLRRNEYQGDAHGTRYRRLDALASYGSVTASYGQYVEDTLRSGGWRRDYIRRTAQLNAAHRFGNLNVNGGLSHVWRTDVTGRLRTFLGRVSYSYRDQDQRFTVGGNYVISDETRNARGITYLQVEPGQGDHILEDGVYLPDPEGDYIRIEEILSDQARVRRGEKSFHFNKGWSWGVLRWDSDLEEELLDGGARSWVWVMPGWFDDNQPYLWYRRHYQGDLRLVPVKGFHLLNISGRQSYQARRVGATDRIDNSVHLEVNLREPLGQARLEQGLKSFDIKRDNYFAAGGTVDGIIASAGVVYPGSGYEIGTTLYHRRADDASAASSRQYRLATKLRIDLNARGELRLSWEGYFQSLDRVNTASVYTLTDNRPGRRGAVWHASLRWEVRRDLRVNMNLSGRNSDDRRARITARGELVAGF